MLSRLPSAVFLWFSVVLFAMSNSIVRILIDLGGQNPIDGRSAITFCSLLFAGNVCAASVLFVVYRKHWTFSNLRALSAGDWIWPVTESHSRFAHTWLETRRKDPQVASGQTEYHDVVRRWSEHDRES